MPVQALKNDYRLFLLRHLSLSFELVSSTKYSEMLGFFIFPLYKLS